MGRVGRRQIAIPATAFGVGARQCNAALLVSTIRRVGNWRVVASPLEVALLGLAALRAHRFTREDRTAFQESESEPGRVRALGVQLMAVGLTSRTTIVTNGSVSAQPRDSSKTAESAPGVKKARKRPAAGVTALANGVRLVTMGNDGDCPIFTGDRRVDEGL